MATKKKPKKISKEALGILKGYRSGLEESVAEQLDELGVTYKYEEDKFSYIKPMTKHKYCPDFYIINTGIYVETKGRFLPEDRKKHLLIKSQHPEVDIRFVFTRSKSPIRKGSKTTYADWCDANGFLYADKEIPREWLN